MGTKTGFQVPPDPIRLCAISSLWASVFIPVKWEGQTLQSIKLFPNLKFSSQEVYNPAGKRSCKVAESMNFKLFNSSRAGRGGNVH